MSGGTRPQNRESAVRDTAARASEAVHHLVLEKRERDTALDLILRWDLTRQEMDAAAVRAGIAPLSDEEWLFIKRDLRTLCPPPSPPGQGALPTRS
ncbi:hypothetical protein ABZU32_06235 [Sphaerisporangium sp. NPDC005288]|uniref:hypothetical protein n=1 Tax=Sphaerisporangium sp. NPDC005288 TaxID=3155114 RepID=UPI0033B09B23